MSYPHIYLSASFSMLALIDLLWDMGKLTAVLLFHRENQVKKERKCCLSLWVLHESYRNTRSFPEKCYISNII